MDTMTPEHQKWDEFIERLEGSEGCDFKETEPGKPTWECAGGRNKDFAKAILETIPNVDIDASLEYFEKRGGYCDCEIIFNIHPLASGNLVCVDLDRT